MVGRLSTLIDLPLDRDLLYGERERGLVPIECFPSLTPLDGKGERRGLRVLVRDRGLERYEGEGERGGNRRRGGDREFRRLGPEPDTIWLSVNGIYSAFLNAPERRMGDRGLQLNLVRRVQSKSTSTLTFCMSLYFGRMGVCLCLAAPIF